MKSLFNRQAERFVRERKRYKRWMAMFLCLAIVVSSGTYASLTWEGRALDEAAEVQAVEVEADAAAGGNGAEVNMIGADGNGDAAGEDGEAIGAPLINGENGGETEAANGTGGKEDASDSATTDNDEPAGSLGGGKDGIEETPGEEPSGEEPQAEEKESVSGNDTPEETEIPEDLSGNDLKEIPPFEMMDLNEYGSMRAMLYSYALTYALPGSMQEQINEAAENGEGSCELMLDHDTAENLVILDDVTVVLDLNGYSLSPERRIYPGSLSTITVYGELILKDSAGSGSITKGGNVADDVRGITVGDGGHLTIESGTIKDFEVEGNGGGVLVENKGACAIEGGTFTDNTAKYYGGGLFAYDAASVTISGATWSGNHAECGGGIAFNKATGNGYTYRNIKISDNTAEEKGGGLYAEGAMKDLSLQDVEVKDNTAKIGGGMYFANGAAVSTSENSVTISGNHATAGSGGGLWMGQDSAFTLTEGNKITGNTAGYAPENPSRGVKGSMGGGFYMGNRSSFTMTGGEISGNNALTHGGGLALASANNLRSSFLMSGGVMRENSVGQDGVVQELLYGGGIYIGAYTESVTLSGDALITENVGALRGGGMYVEGSGKSFLMEGGEISHNRAETDNADAAVENRVARGGGLWCTTPITMTGGVITENYSKFNGGGAYVGNITMSGGEIYKNTASGSGGGLLGSATYTLSGTAKIYENKASLNGGGIYNEGTTIMEAGSLVYSNTGNSNGGGIWSGGFRMNGGEIYDNTSGNWAGGVYANWFTMNGGEIHHNKSGNWGGGVMCWRSDGGATINGGRIYDNVGRGSNGGGLATNGTFTMHGGEIYGNTTPGAGGGVYMEGVHNHVIDGGKIYDNTASGNGGGVHSANSFLKMTGGEISGNTSRTNGGGIYVACNWQSWKNCCGGKRLEISGDAKITGNTANGSGGGIGADWGSVKISGGEITGNAALGNGGGIWVHSSVTSLELEEGTLLQDNIARSKGNDIYGLCEYRYDGNANSKVYKDRLILDICAASETTGGTADSYWLDENKTGGDNKMRTAVDNKAFLDEISKGIVEDENTGARNENAETQKLREVYAYSFGKTTAEVARIDEDHVYDSVQAAVDAIKNGAIAEGEESDAPKTITMLQDSRESVVIPDGVTVSLDLAGHVLKGELSSVIEVEEGANLTILDSSEKGTGEIREGRGKKILCNDGKTTSTFGGGLYVAGEVTLESGTIDKNTASYGGGVYLSDHGVMTMNGGKISENAGRGVFAYAYQEKGEKADADAKFILNDGEISKNSGGGIATDNGNKDSKIEIIMADGVISNNNNTSNYGMGIYIKRGTLKMCGGEIRDNTSVYGGAIYGYVAKIEITGGEIQNNKANNQWNNGGYGGGIFLDHYSTCIIQKDAENPKDIIISGNSAPNGYAGSIYVNDRSNLTVDGAEISGNTAKEYGGGIYANNWSTLTLNSGRITGNTATHGGGVFVRHSTFTASGGEITDNASTYGGAVYIDGQSKVTIGDEAEDKNVLITGNRASSSGGGIYYNPYGSDKNNSWFKLLKKAAVYGNETDLHPSDVCITADSKVLEFSEIEDVKGLPKDYSCWFDYRSYTVKTAEDIKTERTVVYDLAASNDKIGEGNVCRILTGEKEEDGTPVVLGTYPSLAKAVGVVGTTESAEGQEFVIELLKDHEESVEIPSGFRVTVDLGGHTLKPKKTDFTFYIRSNNELTVKNGTILGNEKLKASRGIRVMGSIGDAATAVAALSMENVTVSGFQGNSYGGAIYATGYWNIDLDKVTIRDCSATERGGGIYAERHGQKYAASCQEGEETKYYGFKMTDSRIEACEAKEYGGGAYINVLWNHGQEGAKPCEFVFDGCTVTGNKITGSYGGGLYAGANANNGYVYLRVEDSEISGNEAKANGGGVYTTNLYKTYFTNVEIRENRTTGGNTGGLYINNNQGTLHPAEGARSRTAELSNVRILENTSNGGGAAGAYINGAVIIRDAKIDDNRVLSANGTGGIHIYGEMEVSDSEICRNSAAEGGAVYIANAEAAYPVTFNNVEIADNYARNQFGGIKIEQYTWYRKLYFNNCNIHRNRCGNGVSGGLGTLRLRWSELHIAGTHIHDNVSSGSGAGVFINDEDQNKSQIYLEKYTDLESGEVTETVIENNTAGGSGGGIYVGGHQTWQHELHIQDGTSIRNNTAAASGGGLCASITNVDFSSGEIRQNTAKSGGGVYLGGHAWNYWENSVLKTAYSNGYFKMTGGQIAGNMATENGGGLYVNNYCEENDDHNIELLGGEIKDNRAASYGGGVYQAGTRAYFKLLKGGLLCDNAASLGQDFYGAAGSSHVSLISAKEMFAEDDIADRRGIGWFDEHTDETLYEEVKGKLSRFYALTLLYDNGKTVATIGEGDSLREFTTVQAAVDAIVNKEVAVEEGQVPEIRMVADSVENVVIPAGMTVKLNLNGKTLRGHSTAISCRGNLTIEDKKAEGDPSVGTITGFGVEAGGGVHVLAGGYVTMDGGQIKGCYGGTSDPALEKATMGGAAVCVDEGTFVLKDGSLNHNNARCGSAVLVRNRAGKFRMIGGVIEENTATSYGAVYNNGGAVEIAGGEIRNNTAQKYGGGLYIASGSLNIFGKEDEKVKITGNKAVERGGGIYINNGSANLKNVEINNNATTGTKVAGTGVAQVAYSSGGGICQNIGRLDIGKGVSIMNNSAVRGGGIYQIGKSIIHMIDGVVSKNTAQMGGGVAQYPNDVCQFLLMGGGVYDNISRLTSAGNDFYSRYEGTDPNYGKNSIVPQLTLISAGSMGNGNYNVWKDDAYIVKKGDPDYQRLGEKIGEGQYIIAGITMSFDVDLTAAHYETEEERISVLSGLEVGNMTLEQSTTSGVSVMGTGKAEFDVDAETTGREKTAAQMRAEDPENWVLSDKTYGAEETPYILYTGSEEQYRSDHGNGEPGLYEQEQMADWKPGNDSTADNTLIRTWDEVTYPFTITMEKTKTQVKPGGVSGNDISGNNAPKDKTEEDKIPQDAVYRLWLEVRLPATTEEVDFVTGGEDAFRSMKHYVMETEFDEDGNSIRVMRGYWDLKASEYRQGGLRADSVTIKVLGMRDGDTLKPEFRTWMQGSEEVTKECESKRLTVSAEARYNVTIDYNSALSYTSYFDTVTGLEASEKEMETNPNIVYGTMLGYGATVELYNENTKKGLKGIELPADGIEFDLRFKGGLYMDGAPVMKEEVQADGTTKQVPVVEAPYIWAYKENMESDLGKVLGGTTYSRNMNWNDEDDMVQTTNYAYNAAPFNSGGGETGCYNGGSWVMTQKEADPELTETVVHAKIAGYSVDFGGTSPNQAANKSNSGIIGSVLQMPSVKAFSAGYVQLLFPISDEDVTRSGYLTIGMEAAVTGMKAESISGRPAVSGTKEGDLDKLKKYFGVDPLNDLNGGLAVGEVFYDDNYSDNQFGTYVFKVGGDGVGDNIGKTNYFNDQKGFSLSGQEGNASTPLMSTVYIGGNVNFTSRPYRTDDETDPARYIRPEDYNTQTDNKVEYNYMTAVNILQKFDADAYTPLGSTKKIINQDYTFNNSGIGNFRIGTSETETTWSNTKGTKGKNGVVKTRSCKLSILYGAKPDGTNWTEGEPIDTTYDYAGKGDAGTVYTDGGVRDMDSCREENLIYFESLDDLYQYFGGKDEDGNYKGKCVAILYELRDCCIRTGRSISAQAGMQVGTDFDLVGTTRCTTNDVRIWTNYRPKYKEYYNAYYTYYNGINMGRNEAAAEKFRSLIYTFTWEKAEQTVGEQNGITPYGRGLAESAYCDPVNGKVQISSADEGYQAYFEAEKKVPLKENGEEDEKAPILRPIFTDSYWDNYIKSQYAGGLKVAGTHNGWYSGNTLLIKTLEPKIDIYVADFIEGSGGASNKARKTVYDVSNGERTATFELDPSLGVATGLEDHYLVSTGALSTRIAIDVKLPKKLTYQEGTVRIDYSGTTDYREGDLQWEIEYKGKNADGTSTVRIYTDITDIHKKLPEIFLETFIGDPDILATSDKEVGNGETLKVQALITPIYGKENQMAEKSGSGERSIKISKNTDNAGYIVTETPLTEIGDDIVYDLHYRSRDKVTNVEMIDILPYNEDGRKSSFTGDYRVARVEITFLNAEDYAAYVSAGEGDGEAGGILGYLNDRQKMPGNTVGERNDLLGKAREERIPIGGMTQDAGTKTVSYDLSSLNLRQSELAKDGIALYVKAPQVSENSGFVVKVVLSAKDENGDMLQSESENLQNDANIYGDSFFYCSGGGEAVLIPSGDALARLIGRYISGIAWMDQDNDGKYIKGYGSNASADRVLRGVDVSLYEVQTADNGEVQYVPATDIFGNTVASVKTDADGRYQFKDLRAGTYRVAFENDSNDYKIEEKGKGAKKALITPLSFSRLSVTRMDDSGVRDGIHNYARPYYTEKDTTESPAKLEAAYLYQEIVLPAKEQVRATPYVSGNWNAGLYYIDQNIVKNWYNMTVYDQKKEYGAGFAVTGTYNTDVSAENVPSEQATEYKLSYTMAGNGATKRVEVKGENDTAKGILAEGMKAKYNNRNAYYTVFTPSVTPVNLPKDGTQTYTWKLENLALQAEGRSGKITYTVEEVEAFEKKAGLLGSQKAGLNGFITETEDGDDDTVRRFTADNTQVLYKIDVTKIGELVDGTDIDNGFVKWLGEKGAVTQPGTKFGIYSDIGCKTLLKEVNPAKDSAVSSFMSMPAGTYYMKEMNPPLFYKLNPAVFKLEIRYPEKTEGEELKPSAKAVPTVTLTKLGKDEDGKVLPPEDITAELTVDGVKAPATIESLKNHEIGFEVEDEAVLGTINVHKVDGEGQSLAGVTFRLTCSDRGSEKAFRVLDENGVSMTVDQVTRTTEEDGELSFEGLTPGTYILTETETSDGNSLLMEPVTITVPLKMSKAEADKQNLRTKGEDVIVLNDMCYFYTLNYEISNEAVLKLPETGSVAGAAPIAAVVLLLMAGGYLVIRRRRKEKGNA